MDPLLFYPSHRQGLILHTGAALLLAAADAVSFFYATQQAVGSYFVLLLLLSLVLLAYALLPGETPLRTQATLAPTLFTMPTGIP